MHLLTRDSHKNNIWFEQAEDLWQDLDRLMHDPEPAGGRLHRLCQLLPSREMHGSDFSRIIFLCIKDAECFEYLNSLGCCDWELKNEEGLTLQEVVEVYGGPPTLSLRQQLNVSSIVRSDNNADQQGRQCKNQSTKQACIDFYNNTYYDIVRQGDDHNGVVAAFKNFTHTKTLDGQWLIGDYTLSGWPPKRPFLHLAACYGRVQIVECLLQEFHVDVNHQSKDNKYTALHWAAFYAHESTVRLLCESKADPTIKNIHKGTPTDSATVGMTKWQSKQISTTVRHEFSPWFSPWVMCYGPAAPPSWERITELLTTTNMSGCNAEDSFDHGMLEKPDTYLDALWYHDDGEMQFDDAENLFDDSILTRDGRDPNASIATTHTSAPVL
jgi:hypothetical protein